MLWSLAFVVLFAIGGFSGLMLAIVPADFQYHDTYFVVAHFHYVLVTGALFAIIAAISYWWPKWTGRMYNEFWGKFHSWWTPRSEEHTSALQSQMRISYAVFCLKKKT